MRTVDKRHPFQILAEIMYYDNDLWNLHAIMILYMHMNHTYLSSLL